MDDDRLHNRKGLKPIRRALRNHATVAEAQLWKLLRGRRLGGRKFRRQHSIGPYVVDFYCPAERLAIELDGSVHDDPVRRSYDERRQVHLMQYGLRIIRFRNRQVLDAPEDVAAIIAEHFDR